MVLFEFWKIVKRGCFLFIGLCSDGELGSPWFVVEGMVKSKVKIKFKIKTRLLITGPTFTSNSL
jgi:hypothetical protein